MKRRLKPPKFTNVGSTGWCMRSKFFALGKYFGLALAFISCTFAADQPTEYQVKAAYLFNFTKFVKWPQQPGAETFNVCVLGTDPFGKALDSTIEGEAIEGKKVVVQRIKTAKEATGCKVAFLSMSERKNDGTILRELLHSGILTVSDIPGFIGHGGMIGFVRAGDRIRFEVNLAAAESAQLTVSSELLKVATRVTRTKD
jgi:hypothetical protein